MEIPMKTDVGTIHPDGRITTQTIDVAQWNGCSCVYPGREVCPCDDQCPCKKVPPDGYTRTDAWNRPFR